jgi:hypothetical protein
VASYERIAAKDEFRANIALGGEGRAVELSSSEKAFCVRCANAVGLSVAGVDVMRNREGQLFLIEVNSNFGLNIQKVTGINVAEKLIQYLENEISSSKTNPLPVINKRETDNYLENLLTKVKGKDLKYKNRNGTKLIKRINSVTDLQDIMIDTFTIQ